MNSTDVLQLRLQNQLLTQPLHSPEEVVGWLGAIQAQDYTAAKWAIGLRSDCDDTQIEEAYNQGKILRTHIMRPTWHFVLPKDIRWMLSLTKDRVHQQNAYYYKQSGLTKEILEKTTEILRKLLRNHTYLSREEIRKRLAATLPVTQDTKLTISLLVMYAELEGIICSGPRVAKQFTYALLDERVPHEEVLDKEAALANLSTRYFQSHGPATLQDFMWWSGLPATDAKKGIALVQNNLSQEKLNEKIYFFSNKLVKKAQAKFYLLPNYDEYIVGYKNREFIFDSKHIPYLDSRSNPLFQHTIMYDGKIIGTWKREIGKSSINVTAQVFSPIEKTKQDALEDAINQCKAFMKQSLSSKQR